MLAGEEIGCINIVCLFKVPGYISLNPGVVLCLVSIMFHAKYCVQLSCRKSDI